MLIQIGKDTYWIEPFKVALQLLALIALVASMWDGIPAVIVAVLIYILDELKHPYPVFAKVEEGDEPPNEDDYVL